MIWRRREKVGREVHVSRHHGAKERHRKEARWMRTRREVRRWVARRGRQGLRGRREHERVAWGARNRRNGQERQWEVHEREERGMVVQTVRTAVRREW